MQWGPLLLKEGGMIRMENGINPWYSSTHIIHRPMEFTHGIVNGIRPWYCKIHPWYSFTHRIYPWYCKWHLPVVL